MSWHKRSAHLLSDPKASSSSPGVEFLCLFSFLAGYGCGKYEHMHLHEHEVVPHKLVTYVMGNLKKAMVSVTKHNLS